MTEYLSSVLKSFEAEGGKVGLQCLHVMEGLHSWDEDAVKVIAHTKTISQL